MDFAGRRRVYKAGKKVAEKFRQELENVHDNLDTLMETLNMDEVSLEQLPFGFLHKEPKGIKAVDQRGPGGRSLKQVRLYLYPHRETKTVHVLTIGDKKTQPKDIEQSKNFVACLLSNAKDNQDG